MSELTKDECDNCYGIGREWEPSCDDFNCCYEPGEDICDECGGTGKVNPAKMESSN